MTNILLLEFREVPKRGSGCTVQPERTGSATSGCSGRPHNGPAERTNLLDRGNQNPFQPYSKNEPRQSTDLYDYPRTRNSETGGNAFGHLAFRELPLPLAA